MCKATRRRSHLAAVLCYRSSLLPVVRSAVAAPGRLRAIDSVSRSAAPTESERGPRANVVSAPDRHTDESATRAGVRYQARDRTGEGSPCGPASQAAFDRGARGAETSLTERALLVRRQKTPHGGGPGGCVALERIFEDTQAARAPDIRIVDLVAHPVHAPLSRSRRFSSYLPARHGLLSPSATLRFERHRFLSSHAQQRLALLVHLLRFDRGVSFFGGRGAGAQEEADVLLAGFGSSA